MANIAKEHQAAEQNKENQGEQVTRPKSDKQKQYGMNNEPPAGAPKGPRAVQKQNGMKNDPLARAPMGPREEQRQGGRKSRIQVPGKSTTSTRSKQQRTSSTALLSTNKTSTPTAVWSGSTLERHHTPSLLTPTPNPPKTAPSMSSDLFYKEETADEDLASDSDGGSDPRRFCRGLNSIKGECQDKLFCANQHRCLACHQEGHGHLHCHKMKHVSAYMPCSRK